MTPITSTLTDRYVDATLRSLPARQRPDIERELRASIADAVEGRVEAGDDPAEAERAVLTELGDPARLAARYADRPLHLIGPTVYLDYVRLLVALLIIVVPVSAAGVALARLVRDGGFGAVIGDAVGTSITTAAHIFLWTTLLFAIIERSPNLRSGRARQWTPDALPQAVTPTRRARRTAVVVQTVGIVLLTAAVLLSPVVSPETDERGDPIGILSPWLWETGMVFVVLAVAIVGFGIAIAKYYVRYSVPLALVGATATIAAPALLIWIAANDRLINPAFAAAADWPAGVTQWINIGLMISGVLAVVQAVLETAAGLAARSWVDADWGRMVRTIVDGVTVRLSRR